METQLKPSRVEQIDRWAEYICKNPEEWRKHHTKFIDGQIEMANVFLTKIAKQPEGRKKIAEVRRIKNEKLLDFLCQ